MQQKQEPRIRRLLLDDVRELNYQKTLKKDFQHLTAFMLSEEKQKRLASMHVAQRWLFQSYWLLRALIINLTPTRRLLLIIAFLMLFININADGQMTNLHSIAVILLLFIMMLELKDKLLAFRELEAGHGVQLALMPETSPKVDGWDIWLFSESANEVGGDLVDFLHMRPNDYFTAIGDISGKGLSAALLAVKLQATIRALAADRDSLEGLGKKLNQTFCRDCMPQMFASLLYVEFSSDSNRLRLMNAGHFPPIIIKKDSALKFPKGGAALGLHSSMKFMEQVLDVEDDDLILLYTDGLTEAKADNGEFLGEERLLAFLPKLHGYSCMDAGKKLVSAVDYFAGEEQRIDDISLILLRRKKSAATQANTSAGDLNN